MGVPALRGEKAEEEFLNHRENPEEARAYPKEGLFIEGADDEGELRDVLCLPIRVICACTD